jgi:hypothetical protein
MPTSPLPSSLVPRELLLLIARILGQALCPHAQRHNDPCTWLIARNPVYTLHMCVYVKAIAHNE